MGRRMRRAERTASAPDRYPMLADLHAELQEAREAYIAAEDDDETKIDRMMEARKAAMASPAITFDDAVAALRWASEELRQDVFEARLISSLVDGALVVFESARPHATTVLAGPSRQPGDSPTLHQPITKTPDHARAAIFDAAAYVDAMRSVGAKLHPVRGGPGRLDLDGTYTVEAPTEAKARKRVKAIERDFAPQRAADPLVAARVAAYLVYEAATERFAACVGGDWTMALRELARLDDEQKATADRESQGECDGEFPDELSHAADLASEALEAAFEHALAMPIRRPEDLGIKAEFALRFGYTGGQLKQILAEIVTFDRPHLAGTLPDVELVDDDCARPALAGPAGRMVVP